MVAVRSLVGQLLILHVTGTFSTGGKIMNREDLSALSTICPSVTLCTTIHTRAPVGTKVGHRREQPVTNRDTAQKDTINTNTFPEFGF